MIETLWGFLSIGAVCGVALVMLTLYLNHKKDMKQMEIEELKIKNENPQYK